MGKDLKKEIEEIIKEIEEEPYTIDCEDISGRFMFHVARASTLEEAIGKAKGFTRALRSFNGKGMGSEICCCKVCGPDIKDGIFVILDNNSR